MIGNVWVLLLLIFKRRGLSNAKSIKILVKDCTLTEGTLRNIFALYFYVESSVLCFSNNSAGIYTASHPAAAGYTDNAFLT